MAYASPNQWTSPTLSSRSSRQDEESDVEEERENGEDALLDHVRQLIVDLVIDSSSAGRDAKHYSNNPEAEEDAVGVRERLLEEKLAHVLVELAGEQDNLRLAANAGNALLEELSTVREEADGLQDELEAAQLEQERVTRDFQRLREQNAALEMELQRYDVPLGWYSTEQDALLLHQQQLERRPSLPSRSGSLTRCDSCASQEVQVPQLSQHTDELRRRCLELELVHEKDQQREREVGDEMAQLQQHSYDQNVKIMSVQQDLESVTAQLSQRIEEVESVQAARESLRCTVRRLEAENEELRECLAVRDELLATLENGKVRAATQLQVAENRTRSAEAEMTRTTETLQQLQKQLDNALAQQRQSGRSDNSQRDGNEAEGKLQASQDMEQLLQDVTHEVAALRLENRLLRRQNSVDSSSGGRSRRRKTICPASAQTTAADVLALGKCESTREREIATSSCNSDRASDSKPASAPTNVPLKSETEQTVNTTTGSSRNCTAVDEKKRRKMSLELNWVDMAATYITDSVTEKDGTTVAFAKNCESLSEVNTSEQLEPAEDSKTVVTSSLVKQPTFLSRFSHGTNDCVKSGDPNHSSVRLNGMEKKRPKRKYILSDAEHLRVRDLAIDELKNDAAESPPNSPLYLGLSFIACATAATAAGLLARR